MDALSHVKCKFFLSHESFFLQNNSCVCLSRAFFIRPVIYCVYHMRGLGVFLNTLNAVATPSTLVKRHFKSLHRNIVILSRLSWRFLCFKRPLPLHGACLVWVAVFFLYL